jgi:formate C-acetyltransferase
VPQRGVAWLGEGRSIRQKQGGVTMATIAPQEMTGGKSVAGWEGFHEGLWQRDINLRDFIQTNYEEYAGDESFLSPATDRTKKIWDRLNGLFLLERRKGVLDISPIPSSITAHGPGYIDRENEVIVGLQTEAPSCPTVDFEWC